MRYCFALISLLLSIPLHAQDPLDRVAPEIRQGLETQKDIWFADKLSDAEFQKAKAWLEQQYSRVGFAISVADKAEYDTYFMSLMFATVPEAEFAKMRNSPGQGRTAFLSEWLTNMYPLSTMVFEKTAWLKGPSSFGRERYRMFKDLRERVKLEGMSRRQVEDLLGSPDQSEGTRISYVLGPSFHPIDTMVLHLMFVDGKLKTYRLAVEH